MRLTTEPGEPPGSVSSANIVADPLQEGQFLALVFDFAQGKLLDGCSDEGFVPLEPLRPYQQHVACNAALPDGEVLLELRRGSQGPERLVDFQRASLSFSSQLARMLLLALEFCCAWSSSLMIRWRFVSASLTT